MNWLNSWVSGVVISVILATIIEMIIPEGKNKKYIKTIIGMFILFSIISPLISKLTNEKFDFGSNILEKYNTKYENYNSIDQNREIIEVYKDNLTKEIANSLKDKGYNIGKIEISIDATDSNFGSINSIKIELLDDSKNVEAVNKIEIDVSNKRENNNNSNESHDEIKNYLSETYNIDKQNILIN